MVLNAIPDYLLAVTPVTTFAQKIHGGMAGRVFGCRRRDGNASVDSRVPTIEGGVEPAEVERGVQQTVRD